MAWHPDSGRSPNRGILYADEYVWRKYHTGLREISRRWVSEPPSVDEYAIDVEERMAASARLRAHELNELREECRSLVAQGLSGPFLIPA